MFRRPPMLTKMKIYRKKLNSILGQTMVEYSLLVGIVIAVVVVFSPMVKRGTQGMVKLVADEVGIQKNAESASDEGGLIGSTINTTMDQRKDHTEWRAGTTHSVQTNYTDSTATQAITETNLGLRDQ